MNENGKNRLSKSLFWFLVGGIIFIMVLKSNLSFLDPDLGWHLRVGKDLLLNHIFPRFDIYTNSYLGFPWIAHSWLAEAISFLVYDKFGFLALALFFSFLYSLIFLVEIIIFKKIIKVNNLALLLVGLFGPFCLLYIGSTKMQIFSYLGFSLIIYLLLDYCKNKNSSIYFTPLVFILMVNLHGGFAISLIPILLLAIFGKNKKLFLVFLLSIVATLINPYGAMIWKEVWQTISSSGLHNYIIEWAPLFSYPVSFLDLIFLLLLISSFFISLKKFPLGYLFLVIILLIAAISAKKYMPYLILSGLPLLASALDTELKKFKIMPKISTYGNLNSIIILPFIGLLMAILVSAFSVKTFDPLLDKNNKYYPWRALEYTKANYPQTRMFNLLSWGGYILWKSDYQVFFDGRMAVWQNNNIKPFDEYRAVFEAQNNWSEILDRYRIDTVLIPQKKEIIAWINPDWFNKLIFNKMLNQADFGEVKIKKELETSSFWKKVYEDEVSVIFVRN